MTSFLIAFYSNLYYDKSIKERIRMIYTVTFNPALDYVLRLERLQPGETNRSQSEELYFGGKGINVSRVLKELGQETTALGFIAGFTGEALARALEDRGLRTDFLRLDAGMTRINVKLKEAAETEINAGGPPIGPAEIEALLQKLETLQPGDTLVLAGSVPASVPTDIYCTIAAQMQKKEVRLTVDATGALLLKVLPYRPFLIKPNHRELEELVGRPLQGVEELTAAARELQQKGARNVLISRGAEGALLLDETGTLYIRPAPAVKAVNTVGAGDSMVAGFLAGIGQGSEYALMLAVAAGSATAASRDLATKQEIDLVTKKFRAVKY